MSDVESAMVPIARGARRTAADDVATARPLAWPARPGAAATAAESVIGKRFPTPGAEDGQPEGGLGR